MADLLSGLMKGLGSLMPQDEPGAQYLKAQGEISELKKQIGEIYQKIGKKAVEQYGAENFAEEVQKLEQLQAELTAAQTKADEIKAAEEAKAKAEQEALAARTCTECGYENLEGTRFCQQCGTKMGSKNLCPNCSTLNKAGINFCRECGTKLQ